MSLALLVEGALRVSIFTIEKTFALGSWLIWGTEEDRLKKLINEQNLHIYDLSKQIIELKEFVKPTDFSDIKEIDDIYLP